MDVIERISDLLSGSSQEDRHFPATDLYNEGWMLRLVLDWFDRHREAEFDLKFANGASWYSEALLPSAFLPRHRGDELAESWTHADGVIGQFRIGENGSGDLSLNSDANQLVVTEAKMFSKLSGGVKNAAHFNQAARNVACIAEIIRRAGMKPQDLSSVGFYVIAPRIRIEEGIFTQAMDPADIIAVVGERVSAYDDPAKNQWLEDYFLPLMEVIPIRAISWEEIIEFIVEVKQSEGEALTGFYEECLKFNQFVARRYR